MRRWSRTVEVVSERESLESSLNAPDPCARAVQRTRRIRWLSNSSRIATTRRVATDSRRFRREIHSSNRGLSGSFKWLFLVVLFLIKDILTLFVRIAVAAVQFVVSNTHVGPASSITCSKGAKSRIVSFFLLWLVSLFQASFFSSKNKILPNFSFRTTISYSVWRWSHYCGCHCGSRWRVEESNLTMRSQIKLWGVKLDYEQSEKCLQSKAFNDSAATTKRRRESSTFREAVTCSAAFESASENAAVKRLKSCQKAVLS